MAVDTSALEEEIRRLAVDGMDAAGDSFVELARDRAPRKSGDLIAAIQSDGAQDTGSGASVHVHCDVEYASYQDEGTADHTGNPWLVFEGDDGLVFLKDPKGVRGVPDTRFWSDTEDQGEAIIQEVFA